MTEGDFVTTADFRRNRANEMDQNSQQIQAEKKTLDPHVHHRIHTNVSHSLEQGRDCGSS